MKANELMIGDRMRDFYAEAMRKFIGNAKTLLRSYAEPEPF